MDEGHEYTIYNIYVCANSTQPLIFVKHQLIKYYYGNTDNLNVVHLASINIIWRIVGYRKREIV